MRSTSQLRLLSIPLLLLLRAPNASGQSYGIVETHHGTTFFDGWEFETGYDNTTSGDVFWASNSSVAYTTNANSVILAVDDTTFPGTTLPYLDKRNSVKLLSRSWYNLGTVFVLDASHVPTGCSVWPAWWSQGQDWPKNGEIDIVEVVNQATTNQYALHTNTTCTSVVNATLGQSGTAGSTDCSIAAGGTGCTVTQPSTAGTALNAAGGGVWIMSFQPTTIAMWFFARADVPSGMTQAATTIDVGALGTPAASFGSGGCEISSAFGPQQMTLDITLCGDYAGLDSVLDQTCNAPATGQTCYSTYVTDAGNYAEAYWAINYVNVFGTSDSINTTLSTSSSTVTTTALGTATSTGGTTVKTATATGSASVVATTGVSSANMGEAPTRFLGLAGMGIAAWYMIEAVRGP